MKNILAFIVLLSGFCYSQSFDKSVIIENGSRDKRINIAIMGDGYVSNEQNTFTADATKVINYLFSVTPFKQYKNYFNAYAIKVVSPQTGIKHPRTLSDCSSSSLPVSNPNNYFGSSFDNGVHRCLYASNTNKIDQVLYYSLPDYDIPVVLGNSPEYGGCGGTFAFTSKHSEATEVAVHELGHSFGGLADEYWYSYPGESPNKTQTSNAATIKWKNWLNINGVGIYPHSESPSWYRPHQNCKMRYLGYEFCSVCIEALIEKIHDSQNPVDSYTPSNATTIGVNASTTSIDFNVNLIFPEPNTLKATWTLNGKVIANDTGTQTITQNQLNTGDNSLSFRVYDDSPLLKVNNHSNTHYVLVTWNIKKSALGTIDISKAKEMNLVIYPNPVQNSVNIRTDDNSINSLDIEIVDISGKVLTKKKVERSENDDFSVDVSGFSSQVYIMNISDNTNLLIRKKFIKE